MSFVDSTQKIFHDLKDALFHELSAGEELSINLIAEDSLYVRFNNSKVRQNTSVEQKVLSLNFQAQNRRLQMSFDLYGEFESDLATARSLLKRSRSEIEFLPEDPRGVPLAESREFKSPVCLGPF